MLLAALLAFSLGARADSSIGTTIQLAPGPDLAYRLQTAAILAQPGTTIELPAGRFEFTDQLVIRVSHLTLRGQGMNQTVLSFKNQVNGGEGILVTGDAFTAEDFGIEDTPADGLKVASVNGLTVRRVRAEWTRGPNKANGSYGIYPVLSRNILIEDCVARGASDTGIYVGQSANVILRRNYVYENVAGIELENTHGADAYDNRATRNTGGILVFELPNLSVQNGGMTRVFHNKIWSNNTPSFAPKGNTVAIVPKGTGFMVVADRNVEVFENEMSDNHMVNVAVVSYLVSQLPFSDPRYDPIPRGVYVHDNMITPVKGIHLDLSSEINVLVNALFILKGKPVADMAYDGIGEVYNGAHGLPADEKICFQRNQTPSGEDATVANLQLGNQLWYLPFPGGPVLTDPKEFDCSHPSLPEIALEPALPVPPAVTPPTPDEIAALCGASGSGPNWAALAAVDCPTLSQLRLFADARDPRKNASGGVPYDLTTPLFSDYATKYRFVFVPPGTKATYSDTDAFDFPVGTVLAKTFAFGDGSAERLVETRLLIHRASGWTGLPYVWNEDGADATLTISGTAVDLAFTHGKREIKTRYPVPNANQCTECHSGPDGFGPIGPKARLLNRDFAYDSGSENQLTHWTRLGLLDGAPADATSAPRLPVWNDPKDGTLDRRARAYLEVNCAHCHSETGFARNTALFLSADETNATTIGICKPPVAAGIGAGNLHFDIVPGRPGKSILAHRLLSDEPAVKMPQLGRSVVHEEGAELIESWIRSLKGKCK
jgi:parallel beta-helix repeat protein